MKKLLLIFILIIPFISFSQNKITLKSGESFVASVKGLYGKTLIFYQKIPGMETNRIDISNVTSIAGEVPKSRIKAINKQNPQVQFLPGEFSKKDIKNQTPIVFDQSYQPHDQKNTFVSKYSAGDYLQKSGRLRLTAYAFSAGVGLLATSDSFRDMDTDAQTLVLGVSGIAIIGCYLGAEITLIKAGKKLNQDAITATAAKNGVGIAINF